MENTPNKINPGSKQLNYFREEKYNDNPKLKQFDFFRQEIPIGYAENCTRRFDMLDGMVDCPDLLNMGRVRVRPEYARLIAQNLNMYFTKVVLDLMTYVYLEGDKFADNVSQADAAVYLEQNPDHMSDLLRRFYPSDYYWMDTRDGEGPNNGRILAPSKHIYELTYINEHPEYRKYFFYGYHPKLDIDRMMEQLPDKEADFPFPVNMPK